MPWGERDGGPAALTLRTGRPLAILAGLTVFAAHVVGVGILDGSVRELDARAEGNAMTWASVVATAAAGLGAALLGAAWREHRAALVTLAGLIALLSLDDAIALHERLAERVTGESAAAGDEWTGRVEILLLAPVLVVVAIGLIALARRSPRRTGRTLVAGLVTLGAALVIEEMVGSITRSLDGSRWPDTVRIALEEGAELAGWALIATATLSLALGAASPGPELSPDDLRAGDPRIEQAPGGCLGNHAR